MQPVLAIANVLRVAIDSILAQPGYAIYAKQNYPRPAGDYAVIDFLADNQRGWEQSEWTDESPDTSKETIRGYRELGFTITAVGATSIDNSRKIRTGLTRESIIELFKAMNIGLLTRSSVREVSTPLDNGWEERSVLDVTVSAIGTDEDIVGVILSAFISGTFEFPSGIYLQEINIP